MTKKIITRKKWYQDEIDYVKFLRKNGLSLSEVLIEVNNKFKNNRTENSVFHVIKKFELEPKKKRWTEEEKNYLIGINNSNRSYELLASELNEKFNSGRTPDAVQNKLIELKIKRVQWTEFEIDYLYELLEKEKSTESICKKLNLKFKKNRTVNAIRDKMCLIGIKRQVAFHKHNQITQKEVVRKLNITVSIYESLIKILKIKPLKQDIYLFINIDDFLKMGDYFKKLIPQKEVMELLNKSYDTIRRLAKKKRLKSVVLAGKFYFFKDEVNELKTFLSEYVPITQLSKELYYSCATLHSWLKKFPLIRNKKFNAETHIHKIDFMSIYKQETINNWTQEEIDYLQEMALAGTLVNKIRQQFQIKFGRKKTGKDIDKKIKELNITFNYWTPKEIELLKNIAPKINSLDELADKFNNQSDKIRSKEAIRTKAVSYNLVNHISPLWTPEEIEALKDIYASYDNPDCLNEVSEKLYLQTGKKRTPNALHRQLSIIGIYRPIPNRYIAWNEEEIELLKKLAKNYSSVKKLYKQFNEQNSITKTYYTFYSKLKELNLEIRTSVAWTEEELKLLQELVPLKTSFSEVTRLLNEATDGERTKTSIICKAKKLKLKLGKNVVKENIIDLLCNDKLKLA